MLNKSEEIFDFLHVLSFVTLLSGNQKEPLHFVRVIEKGTAHEDLTDSYGYFITSGEKVLKGFHLKVSRSKQTSRKKFQILPTPIVFAPDEVFDTYVDISDDLHLNSLEV